MGDLCISLSEVKPGFIPAAKALNRDGDDKVCKSENPGINDADFESFVNTIRITPEVKKVPTIELPEMIALSGELSIMKGEVTVGLFKQVMQGYKFNGMGADKIKAILDDPLQADKTLTYVGFFDAREFAKRLSAQTGRNFRIQTEDECLAARGQLSGNHLTLTETKYDVRYNARVLCNLLNDKRYVVGDLVAPVVDVAIRLVEDK